MLPGVMATTRRRPAAPAVEARVRVPWLALAVVGGFAAAFVLRSLFRVDGALTATLFDDAMVSMRYARNLVDGHGLVWNPGEAPVEGYTNFLWVLWLAVLHATGLPDRLVSVAVMASGAAILAANVVVVASIARRLAPGDRLVAGVAVWLTALAYPLLFWTLRGMEVGLVALTISVGLLLVARLGERFRWADVAGLGVAGVAAVLTRSDALVAFAILAVAAVVVVPAPRRLVTAVVTAGPMILTLVAHTAFRLAYYGQTLPNTYHLKMDGASALTRLGRGAYVSADLLAVQLAVPVLLAAGAFAVRRGGGLVPWLRSLPLLEVVLLAVFSAQVAYSAYVGGDAWEWMRSPNRYVAVGLPALFLLAGLGARRLTDARNDVHTLWWAAIALVVVVAVADPAADRAADGLLLTAPETAWLGGVLPWVAAVGALALGLAVARRRSVPHERLALAVGAVAVLAASTPALAHWARDGAAHADADVRMTRLGVAIDASSDPEARLASTWAGSLPYFARRTTIDILGKNDPRIAEMEPVAEAFRPGHTKWDHEYSIGELRPEIVAQAWGGTASIADRLTEWGYVETGPVWVLAGSPLVDREALAAAPVDP
jgi:hypothetical protein